MSENIGDALGDVADVQDHPSAKKRLFIIGAGNFGREVYGWTRDISSSRRSWYVAGFLDSRRGILDDFQYPIGVLGDPLEFPLGEDDVVICAVGDPKVKLEYCNTLLRRGARFANVIHPTVIFGFGCELGPGCIICPYSTVSANAKLGNFVTVNTHCSIGHDAVIRDGCTLSPHAAVTGWVSLGQGVFLGTHASVLPRVTIGDFAVIGAGSAVLSTVPAATTVLGVPAKKVFAPTASVVACDK